MMARVTIDRYEMENVEWKDVPKQKRAENGRRRLLITTDNFLPRWDGISRFLSEIIPRLKADYDITVVAPMYGEIVIDGVEIVQIPLARRPYGDYTPARFAYKRIARLVQRSDIVFNQALGPIGMCAILAAKRHRRPIVNYIHSVEWELVPKALAPTAALRGPIIPFTKLAARFFYNRCSALIVPSENIAELFSWQRITTPKRVVHLGVDTAKFAPGDREAAREQLQLPTDAFIVGYHGRIGHEKNLLTLLRAFRRLRAKSKRLLIVGDGIPALKSKLLKFNDVIVTGSTNHVVPWLHAMDVYVQPSFTETTSLTVLEAMSCGLPVLSSKVGFIQHYIVDEENGLFFNNKHPYDLFAKIARLHDDPVLRSTLGTAARKTVVQKFNWELTAKGIKDVLDEL
jgi:glycosyltransferase involved in cell wall biosynthesis